MDYQDICEKESKSPFKSNEMGITVSLILLVLNSNLRDGIGLKIIFSSQKPAYYPSQYRTSQIERTLNNKRCLKSHWARNPSKWAMPCLVRLSARGRVRVRFNSRIELPDGKPSANGIGIRFLHSLAEFPAKVSLPTECRDIDFATRRRVGRL
jgi:hypothetical protein